MPYPLNQKLRDLVPYEPIAGSYQIRLDANESCYALPDALHQRVLGAVGKVALNRYPDPLAKEVSHAFAGYYGISPDCVTAGNGSDELISVITSCFLESGDTVVTLAQDFSMYAFYAGLYELNVAVCPKEADLSIDPQRLIRFCKEQNAKALIFSNPCNPTSLGLDRSAVRRILSELDCLVILDEAYMDFWDQSMLPELSEYDNCIILKTCSKAFGLAAVRLGFAVAGKTITRAMRAAKSPYNSDSIAQAIGTTILAEHDYLRDRAAALIDGTKSLYEGILALSKAHPGRLMPIGVPCTNFVYCKAPDADRIHKALLSRSIAIRKFPEYLRICTGTPAENEALLQALSQILSDTTGTEA